MTPIRKFVLLLHRGMGLKTKDGQQPMPDIDGEMSQGQVRDAMSIRSLECPSRNIG